MKKDIRILGLIDEVRYHEVPNSLERATISPEKEAIFRYISQISYKDFPGFIRDILVQIHGHEFLEISDGGGDEGQDILTKFNGKLCLTQCKHTENLKGKYNGDESDKLFASCFRKSCELGYLATNTDLTTQAKRYFTDREYERNQTFGKVPELDYWNGERIWNDISKSSSILNKWFSGMAQVHGLRKFQFSVVCQRCPHGTSENWPQFTMNKMLAIPVEEEGKIILSVPGNSDFAFGVQSWFKNDLSLGIPYTLLSEPEINNVPLYSLEVNVSVASSVNQYKPEEYKRLIVQHVSDFLPALNENEWWHVVATPCEGAVFFQETNSPSSIVLTKTERFIKVPDVPLLSEDKWLEIDNGQYLREEKDGFSWRTLSENENLSLNLYVTSRLLPIAAFQQYLLTKRQIERMRDYKFFCVINPTEETFDTVRHLAFPFLWPVMQSSKGDLFWACPSAEVEKQTIQIQKVLERTGISVRSIKSEGREKILDRVEMPTNTTFYASGANDLVFPVSINERIIQASISKVLSFDDSLEVLAELLMFKLNFEAECGFDPFKGKLHRKIASEEIRGQLLDLLTFRGRKMLDLSFREGKLSIFLRSKLTTQEILNDSAARIRDEIQKIAEDIEDTLKVKFGK